MLKFLLIIATILVIVESIAIRNGVDDRPEEVMERAKNFVGNKGYPHRFFLTTKYATATTVVTSTSLVTKYNTCFKAEEGIKPCLRKRRSYEVDVQPPSKTGKSDTYEVNITPTKVTEEKKDIENTEDNFQLSDLVDAEEKQQEIGIALPIENPYLLEVLIDTPEQPFLATSLNLYDHQKFDKPNVTDSKDEEKKDEKNEETSVIQKLSNEAGSNKIQSSFNWVERDIIGINPGGCFDPFNIAHRFLTILETRTVTSTAITTSPVLSPETQTISFASANACLPTNVKELFSIECE